MKLIKYIVIGLVAMFVVYLVSAFCINTNTNKVQRVETVEGRDVGSQSIKAVKSIRIGDERMLTSVARLMVQEGAFWLQQKARSEHDNNSLFRVWDSYDYIDALNGDKVTIITFTNDIGLTGAQVEVTSLYGGNIGSRAKLLGRRGWMSSNAL